MARVAAIRQAEIMKQDLDNPARSAAQQPTPGLVVVIQSADGRARQFPQTPAPMAIEHDPLRDDLGSLGH
jgi:hypothetical protein